MVLYKIPIEKVLYKIPIENINRHIFNLYHYPRPDLYKI